jgi:hypothetical protein
VKRSAGAFLAAFVVLVVPSAARAHPGYPAKVDAAFGVHVATIVGGTGCHLCHVDPDGSGPLRPFGQRLVSTYGLDPSAENDPSLEQALKGLQMGDPLLVQDLQKGLDPNPDVTNDPTAGYGCAVVPRRSGPGYAMLIALSLALGSACRRRRRVCWGR